MSIFAPRCPVCHNRMGMSNGGEYFCYVNGCPVYEKRKEEQAKRWEEINKKKERDTQ